MAPRTVALAGALFLAALRLVQAQEAVHDPTFRVSVDRIQIGVVVTDSKGRHRTDLGVGDFMVFDGGKRQTLTNSDYVRLATPGAAVTAIPERNEGRGSPTLPPGSAPELVRDQIRRSIVFLIDDVSFQTLSIPVVREAVRNTIDRSLQPGDIAALIRTSSGNGALEQFTADKRVLLASVEKIQWRPESRGNPGMLAQTTGTVVGERDGRYLVDLSIDRTNAVLRYAIHTLRDLPGRKAIFLVSQSLPISINYVDPNSPNRRPTELGWLVDEALRAGVVVYSLDPTPLSSLTPDASYDLTREYTAQNGISGGAGSMSNREAVNLLTGYSSRALGLLEVYRAGLRSLAEGTGGQMSADTDLATAMGRFADDLQGYYLLTYKPQFPERYFAQREGDPLPFRTIKVRVSGAGMRVRSYAGYIAGSERVEPEPAQGGLSKALFSPLAAAGVRVDLTSIFTQPRPGSPELNLLMHIDAGDLSFAPGEGGRHDADFEVVARVASERNEPAQVVSKDVALRLQEKSYAEAREMGFTYRVSVPAQRPGLYEVRVAVRDRASGKLGSARGFVEVPDLRTKRLAVSGILAYNKGSRERDPEAPGLAERRLFKRTDWLTYACQAFNAKAVTGEARIVRDGKSVLAVPAEVSPNGDGTFTLKGALPLTTLASGYYALQIAASTGLGKDAEASQWTDFEIVH